MQLALFNGSPRGGAGNSQYIIDSIVEGLEDQKVCTISRLNRKKEDHKALFQNSDTILIVFPLYVDSMPGLVKEFIETLDGDYRGKSLGFIVHSGLPEPSQCQPLEAYLRKLSRRLNCRYMGTLIRGGTEITRIPPLQKGIIGKFICLAGSLTNLGGVGFLLNRKRLRRQFIRVGRSLSRSGSFDKKTEKQFRKPARLGPFGFFLYKNVGEKLYWEPQLQANGVGQNISRRPYEMDLR